MNLRILTANIAFGFAGMDHLLSSVKHHLHIHGLAILNCGFSQRADDRNMAIRMRRVWYVKKHQNLNPTFDMIWRIQPDILILNEVIYELNREPFEEVLDRIGFRTMEWGVSNHYPGASISTLLATRASGTSIRCAMPQRPSMGGGAGMAGIELTVGSLRVFGMHLTYGGSQLFERQVKYIAEVARNQATRLSDVVVAGDWNASEATIFANQDFRSLNLVSGASIENPTCPSFFPRFLQRPLDHVFVPSRWKRVRSEAIAFGSDHLALMVDVESTDV
jgi:endonuclease/exonuclease/phosphatase family metal-dependent hydrolase